jgi:hypothetical protein
MTETKEVLFIGNSTRQHARSVIGFHHTLVLRLERPLRKTLTKLLGERHQAKCSRRQYTRFVAAWDTNAICNSFYQGWSFPYSELDYGGFVIIAGGSTPSPSVSLVLRMLFS